MAGVRPPLPFIARALEARKVPCSAQVRAMEATVSPRCPHLIHCHPLVPTDRPISDILLVAKSGDNTGAAVQVNNPPKPRTSVILSFGRAANIVATTAGKPWAFAIALSAVLLWVVSGPIFGFSDTWQLVINTGTTIVTFLMVFLIQNSQNRDGAAIQVKLDELIRVSAAKNFFVGIEHLSEEEIERLRTICETRARSSADRTVEIVDQKAKDAADQSG